MMEETADTYLPEHPWPYLGELFELEKRKDSLYFEYLLCLSMHNTISLHTPLQSSVQTGMEFMQKLVPVMTFFFTFDLRSRVLFRLSSVFVPRVVWGISLLSLVFSTN